ncbi:hypothetical protein A7982_13269 [Minicystis rosea]|nr:hypothetical protein A7982_13269 [Minicystis rosea]
MSFANTSLFAALPVPYTGPDGSEFVIAVVKATFFRRATGRLVLADEQGSIRPGDVPYFPDAPRESSVRYPSDICTAKRGTDLVIVGEAVSTRPVEAVDVAVRVRDRNVCLRVHGERVFYRGGRGITIGPAAPFERKPIVWERAYGGASSDHALVERRNPVGRGVAHDPNDLLDRPAPQIEDPAAPITGASDRPEPVGFGAVGPHWLPRCACAGTFDDAWRTHRMPLLPADFDIRFNNVAPQPLQFDAPLVAGERIALLGMHPDGVWQVELPRVPMRIAARLHDGRRIDVRPHVDTVLLEPGKDEVQLTLRYAFAVGRGKSLLREIRIDEHAANDTEAA